MQFIFYLLKKSPEACAPNKPFYFNMKEIFKRLLELNTRTNKFKYYKLKKYYV